VPALAWITGAAAAGVAAWGLFQLRTYLAVGAGYKAKVLCTGIFGSGRALDPQHADQVSADSYWLLSPFSATVDRERRTVTTSLFGLRPRTAVYRDRLGATLLSGSDAPFGSPPPRATTAIPARSWPARHATTSALQTVVHDAFTEPRPTRRRRTYAVVIVQDGEIIAERYAAGITADMPMPGWSMAKSVLNSMVGILVSEGHLALDDRELLPHWRSPDARAAISLEDLLRMRSGLRFSEQYANPWSDVLHMLYDARDTAAFAASLPLASAPGTAWSYSSGTTNILSNLVRRAVGEDDYFAWPHRMLFEPAGMASAVLEPDTAGTFVCSSYMLATARDWARYGQLWLDNGRCDGRQILDPAWIRFSLTPTPQSGGRFGAHWWLALNPELGGDSAAARAIPGDAFFAVGHEAQTLTVVPSRRLVVVRLGAAIHIDAWNHAGFIANVLDAI
jgi:CubicO group peptidase (beta-lactamase class C family)